MSMKIKQINDYCSGGGFASPRSAGLNLSASNDQSSVYNAYVKDQPFPTIGTTRIKAIAASNYQIFVYSNPANNTVRMQIRNEEIINSYSTSSCAYLFTFGFDENLKLINKASIPLQNTSLESIALSIPSTGMFAIVALNQSLSPSARDILSGRGDFFIISSNTAPIKSYVAVGYNGQIIDSMINGGIAGSINSPNYPSQLFVNGLNVVSSVISNGGNPTYAYFNSAVDVDYFVLKHNDTYESTGRYIIKSHTVSVVNESGTSVVLKYSSNSYIETFHGERYYLFDTIGKDKKIDAGYISSISMFGTQAASRRFVNQEFVPFFSGRNISKSSPTVSDISTIISKANAFNITNTDIVKKSDIESAIKTMTAIQNSSCSYQCESNCIVMCFVSCGVRCQGACANNCGGSCGSSNCWGYCGGNCSGGCLWSCYSNCYGICTGNCGSTCGNSCGTGSCTASCQYNCSGGCIRGDSSSGSCARCWGKCSGCKHGCDGDCDGTCLNSCSGRCAGECAGGGCSGSCTSSCSNGCYWFCYSGCADRCTDGCAARTCTGDCTLSCSPGCSILCQNGCSGSCTSSCNGSCITAAASGNPYFS